MTDQLEAAPCGKIRVYDEHWFLILTRNIELGENVPRAADKAAADAYMYPTNPKAVIAEYNGRRDIWHIAGNELIPHADWLTELLDWPTP